ncbi:MAG: type II toxin-antitoxin system RelE/ParE family toxin [Euryarchaeota archaeon]|nr:type II toxin-antitoxin system RelE/ParE family toxin [Euryarchaeota archaeon]
MYEVRITEPVEKEIKKLDKIKVMKLFKQFEKLEKRPDMYGKPLRGSLSGLWQLRSGKYRIWYTIESKSVYIRAVKHKDDAKKYY